MTRAIRVAALALALGACARPDGDAQPGDTTTLAPIDTVKPLLSQAQEDSARRADSARVADSVRAAQGAKSAPGTKTATRTPTKADSLKLSPNIGHDSVIRRPRRIP